MVKCDFNKVILTGYPTKRPELKLTTTGTPVMNFTLRSDNTKNSEYMDITVWGELAEKVYRDLDQTTKIMVEGALHRRSKSGDEYGSVEISANRIFALGDSDVQIY